MDGDGEQGFRWWRAAVDVGGGGPVFLGTHPLRLDEKGRLVLPARWRGQLEAGLVIAKGQEHCLALYTQAAWDGMSKAMATEPATEHTHRQAMRMLYATASDQVPDKQGRVTVPTELRAYADLDRECVVVGANSKAEIWNPPAWATYTEVSEPALADLTGGVLPGLL